MATDAEQSFLDTLPESEVTQEDIDSAEKKATELAAKDFQQEGGGFDSTFYHELDQYRQGAYDRTMAAREGVRQRREAGLEDEGIFEIATQLSGVASGEIESADRRRTRESLEAMASGQRGRGQSGTGLRSAARLRGGETNAQAIGLIGGEKLSEASEIEREAASGQLRDLLIQGRTRAENKELRMQEIAFQRDQANKGFWGDVLSGVLGAIGGAVGFVASGFNPAGAVAGATILGGAGKAAGRTFG